MPQPVDDTDEEQHQPRLTDPGQRDGEMVRQQPVEARSPEQGEQGGPGAQADQYLPDHQRQPQPPRDGPPGQRDQAEGPEQGGQMQY